MNFNEMQKFESNRKCIFHITITNSEKDNMQDNLNHRYFFSRIFYNFFKQTSKEYLSFRNRI